MLPVYSTAVSISFGLLIAAEIKNKVSTFEVCVSIRRQHIHSIILIKVELVAALKTTLHWGS